MLVTKALVDAIVKTLPLNYYFPDCKAEIIVDEKAETSYWIPALNKIHISLPALQQICKKIEVNESLETFVRSNLYHELSHALLTPPNLIGEFASQLKNNVTNVFEDERIETLLRNFYLGVDFKRNIILLNGWEGEPPKSAFEAFYHTVRFRSGKEVHLKKVNSLIHDYASLTSESWPDKFYLQRIWDLYLEVAKDWATENDKDTLDQISKEMFGKKGESGSGSSSRSPKKGDDFRFSFDEDFDESIESKDPKRTEGSKGSGESKGSGDSKGSGSSEGSGDSEESKEESTFDSLREWEKRDVIEKYVSENDDSEDSDYVGVKIGDSVDFGEPGSAKPINFDDLPEDLQEKLKDLIKKAKDQMSQTEADPLRTQKVLKTALNRYIDVGLTEAMEQIIDNFKARQKNNAACLNGYSGRINPKLVGRKDWRVFEKKAPQGVIKGYDALHLILYVDVSGSYCSNEVPTNTILRSLDDIEAKNPWFSFDLVTMSVGEVARGKDERFIKTGGGNRLDNQIWSIARTLNRPDQLNYSIVLFDGDAFTDCGYNRRGEYQKNFGVWDNPRCTIISDWSNEEVIKKYASQAYVKINKGRQNYSQMLFENILDAMQKILIQ